MIVNYSAIGKKIKHSRQMQDLTQEDLAYEIDTSPAYISNIERGKKKPSLQKLMEITEILEITINDLLYD